MKRSNPRVAQALLVATITAAASITAPAAAVQYDLTLDVPTRLGGIDYTPNQILRWTGGGYVVEADFPPGLEFAALARTPEGMWLLTPAFPILSDDPEDLAIETRDIILYDPVNDVPYVALDGSAAGVPAYAAIDAVMFDRVSDQVVVSFDVPVILGGLEFGPSDLVAFGASGFIPFWSAAAAGVPPYANVVGADQDAANRLVLSFDVPTTIAGLTYLPGQLVLWTPGSGFALYASDPAWPVSSMLGDFGFLPASGLVPDGAGGSVPLTVTPATGGGITLSWGASCAFADSDFAVYEGTIGAPFATHVPITCSTGGATTWTFTPGAGNTYYYVVPRNAVTEGSYGSGRNAPPRPPSAAACLPQESLTSCH